MTRSIIFLCILFFPTILPGQQINPLFQLQKNEQELVTMFDSLYRMDDHSQRDSLNQQIIHDFSKLLSSWEGYNYRWNALPRMGKLFSEDNKLRIFTWYLPDKNGDYTYYGLVSFLRTEKRRNKAALIETVILQDESANIAFPENEKLSPSAWYGCVYYALKSFRHRRNTWYALIGYDFNTPFSDKKIIEILSLNKNGVVDFAGNFKLTEKETRRMIFEYSSEVAMFLNYDPRLDRIVFDHLRPFEPILTGNYRFYGPDGSYDAFRFEKGTFILEEDVDARNE